MIKVPVQRNDIPVFRDFDSDSRFGLKLIFVAGNCDNDKNGQQGNK
jgi:hypothetical protein